MSTPRCMASSSNRRITLVSLFHFWTAVNRSSSFHKNLLGYRRPFQSTDVFTKLSLMSSKEIPLCLERICCFPERRIHLRNSVGRDDENDTALSPRKKYRPGFNSYLKVELDDTTIDKLHDFAVEIQRRLAKEEATVATEQTIAAETTPLMSSTCGKEEQTSGRPAEESKNHKNALRFKPRSRQSLHMTLFFAGEVLCEIPKHELANWHSRISARLSQSGFHLCANQTNQSTDPRNSDFSFQVHGLKVFPPRRNNLVVAILEPAKPQSGGNWQELYRDIVDISKDETCSKVLTEISKRSYETWMAHVTLGNLYGGKSNKYKQLDSMLDEVFAQSGSWQADVRGIGMGGPVPKQATLDWNFQLESRDDPKEKG